jgi:predicted HTH domain antitoxin
MTSMAGTPHGKGKQNPLAEQRSGQKARSTPTMMSGILAMQVTIELPDELADQIRKTSGAVARIILEAFAIDSYRSGKLTGGQVRQLLGLETRFELDALLKRAGVFREYTAEELERDFEASRQASSEHLRPDW